MSVKGLFSRDSGVSETIGFIIIFGIVMTGIAIVTLYGYPALIQEQSNANIKNMEKNMLVLQSDIKSLTFKSVPYQETAMQVSGGTLKISDSPDTQPVFTIYDNTGAVIETLQPGELSFTSSDGMVTIVLENGAIHIRYWNSPGAAMLANPSWFYDEATNTYVIQMIRMTAVSDLYQTGIGTIKMNLTNSSQSMYDISSGGYKISYTPAPEWNYGMQWSHYFTNPELGMQKDGATENYILNPNAKNLIVKKYNVTFLSL